MSQHFIEYLLRSKGNLQSIDILNDELFDGTFSESFKLRYAAIQNWFLRASFHVKIKFLKSLFEQMNVNMHIKSWFKFISETSFQKLRGYTNMYDPLDNVPLDHNRTLDTKELEEAMKHDLEWFQNFDDDLQFNVYIMLLQLGGSPLTQTMSIYMMEHTIKILNLRNSYTKDALKILEDCKPASTVCVQYEEKLNAKDTFTMTVMKERMQWVDAMTKYRKEVEAKVNKGTGKKKKGKKDKKKKGKKDKKKSKNDKKKGKKTSKKSKSKKSKKEAGCTDLDYIQVMPINVVKKIFSYLDKKTLKTLGKVNLYWNYAVASLEEDLKTRKMLDKLLETYRVEVAHKDLKGREKIIHKDRADRQWREVACNKNIQKSMNAIIKHRNDYTLLQTAVQQIPEEYVLPVYNLGSFSRKVAESEKTNLYESPPKMRTEMGFLKKKGASEMDMFGEIRMFSQAVILNPRDSLESAPGEDDDEIYKVDTSPSSLFVPYQSNY